MKKSPRRNFLFVAGALAAAPLAPFAQPAQKVRRIGILYADTDDRALLDRIFFPRLRELGWTEGTNLAVDIRFAKGDFDRLPQFALELVQQGAEIIFTGGNPRCIQAAKEATSIIPIVFAGGYPDNVRAGLIESLARPGGNVTGATFTSEELPGKRLQLLKDVIPDLSRIGRLGSNAPGGSSQRESLTGPLRLLGVEMTQFIVRAPPDFEGALLAAKKAKVRAFYVNGEPPLTGQNGARMAELLIKYQFPSVAAWSFQADLGFLMAYGPAVGDIYRTAAAYIDKIFKGARPADLPVQQPTRYYLVVNLKTAKALDLKIPQAFLLRADRVIE